MRARASYWGAVARLFLYGTLMRGGANHAVLEAASARFVGRALTVERRRLVDLGPYPALVPGAGATAVHGEVFDVADAALAELDDFEGCPTLYRREAIAVIGEDGTRGEAFTYVLARAAPQGARDIEDGRYDPTCRSAARR